MYTCGVDFFNSGMHLVRQYAFILVLSTFFTVLGLFDTLFDEHMSNNSHVFFIPCCPCDNIMPVWSEFVPVCPGH